MTYAVRPVTFKDHGVYEIDAVNSRAAVIFEGTQAECYEKIEALEEEKAHEIECLGYDPETVEPDAETRAELEADATQAEPFTKDQEREALAAIMAIVNSLPEDSYVKKACEGLEEIATDNIGNDFCESWKARCLHHITETGKKEDAARREAKAQKAAAEWERQQRQEAERKLEALETRYDDLRDDLRECNAERIDRDVKLMNAELTIKELKAKLYDLMIA